MVKLTFCSGVGTVTGANFLYEIGAKKILVDCGLIQGDREMERRNTKDFGYDPKSIDILLITHAHLDHVGRIPKLVREGFQGVIYSTPETKALAALILEDAEHIMFDRARREGVLPLYDKKDVASALSLWQTFSYHEHTEIASGIYVTFKDAGHILGSAMIEIESKAKQDSDQIIKTLFTGDLGNTPTPLLRNTESVGDADYMVIESVYGDRNHEPKDLRRKKFEDIVTETISKGGTIIIPAFSLERTQVILYELNDMAEKGRLHAPVFVDSPLATKVTSIYRSSSHLFNQSTQDRIRAGDDVFAFPRLKFTLGVNESQGLDRITEAKVILAGSGMSMGGRVRQHEATYLPDKRNTILLVGFQPLGTLGRELQNGVKKVIIDGQEIPVKAKIETIFGYSSHKDSDNLVDFVSTGKNLKKVFVAMGEPKASMALAQRINYDVGIQAIAPNDGDAVEL